MTNVAASDGPTAVKPEPAKAGSTGRAQRWITAADGQRLRRIRRERGLSQEGLADLAGVGLTTVARLERQTRSPCRTWTLAMLASALEEPFASLVLGTATTSSGRSKKATAER
jgi:DNA-binding XRE family transcriptional regulator